MAGCDCDRDQKCQKEIERLEFKNLSIEMALNRKNAECRSWIDHYNLTRAVINSLIQKYKIFQNADQLIMDEMLKIKNREAIRND